ncbi:MAG: hypothetical protein H6711_17710 [Myxococcales bacterium]|nr:hypothetical protein [Myxococcales bacterium]
MAAKKRFLLRIDPRLWAALERWAADDLRSVNGQIEYLLTQAARRAGRLGREAGAEDPYRGSADADEEGEGGGEGEG